MKTLFAWACAVALWISAAHVIAAESTEERKNPVLGSTVDPATLRLVVDERGTRLIGDLLLTLPASLGIAAAADAVGTTIEVTPDIDRRSSNSNRVRLRGLDLSSGSVLSVAYSSGQTFSGRLPGLAVDADVSAGSEAGSATAAELDAAWSTLLASVGARAIERPARFAYFARWNVAAAPHFTATKEDRASREDKNEVATILNRGVYQRGDKSALTLERALTSIEWRDGTAIAAKSRGSFVHATSFDDARRPEQREISFTLRDAFGKSVERRIKVHSHGLVDANAGDLPELVSALTGIETNDLAPPDPKDYDASYLPLASERAALTRLFVRSALDGVVTPDELGAQVRLAKLVGTPRP